ncbi:MAG: hypothetical protein KIS73_20320 [Enhydrobacter sp.]|nr:hypothetical protein [Enhydrobacter sp.]
MSRTEFVAAILVGSLAVAATAFAAQPVSVSPQARAEMACRDHGVQPRSAAWERCLSHVTRAYEWGERSLAKQLARAAGDARVSCLEEGFRPEGQGYATCVNKEIEANSQLLILGDDQSGVNVAEAR